MMQDVVTCIRLKTTIEAAGFARERHAGRHLHEPDETARLFARHPEALARAAAIAEACRFSLDELTYTTRTRPAEDGRPAQVRLAAMTWEGAAKRFPAGVPEAVRQAARGRARSRRQEAIRAVLPHRRGDRPLRPLPGHPVPGPRLGGEFGDLLLPAITAIDPVDQGLLFARFINETRDEPPDIDVDFEHERREEGDPVDLRHLWPRPRALTASVIRYGARGAVCGRSARCWACPRTSPARSPAWSGAGLARRRRRARGQGARPRPLAAPPAPDAGDRRALIGTPRHFGQHPGGFVLTLDRSRRPLPGGPGPDGERQIIEWDKDDIETLRFMKVDVLGLGMLGCLRRAFTLLASNGRDETAAGVPDIPRTIVRLRDDPEGPTRSGCSRSRAGQMAMAAADAAQGSLRPHHRGRDRAAGPDPGRHGPPYLRRRRGIDRSLPTEP